MEHHLLGAIPSGLFNVCVHVREGGCLWRQWGALGCHSSDVLFCFVFETQSHTGLGLVY